MFQNVTSTFLLEVYILRNIWNKEQSIQIMKEKCSPYGHFVYLVPINARKQYRNASYTSLSSWPLPYLHLKAYNTLCPYVANTLFRVCVGVGGLYFAFGSLLTCTEWHLSLGLSWGHVGLRVACMITVRHHVFRLGSLIGLRSMASEVWRGSSGVMSVSGIWFSGSWAIGFGREGLFSCVYGCYNVNRRRIEILLLRS